MVAPAVISGISGLAGLGFSLASVMQRRRNLTRRFMEDLRRTSAQQAAAAASGIDNPFQRQRATTQALQRVSLANAPIISQLRMADREQALQRRRAIFATLAQGASQGGAFLAGLGQGPEGTPDFDVSDLDAAGGAPAAPPIPSGPETAGALGIPPPTRGFAAGRTEGAGVGPPPAAAPPPPPTPAGFVTENPFPPPSPTVTTNPFSREQAAVEQAQEEFRRRIMERLAPGLGLTTPSAFRSPR